MKQYNAIFISDVHMGTKHAQVDKLLTFLKETECRHLYIVGDLIDGWELKRKWYWDDTHNLLVQKLLRKSRHHTNITYITGNHDEFVEQFIGQNFGGVKIMKKTMHTGVHGKRYLVMHGHQFDGLVHCGRLLERIGSAAYQYVLSANTLFNKLRRRFGFGYWSLARFVKMNTKRAVKFITDFEDGMVSMARAKKVDGIICGHIHMPEIRKIDNMDYLNCGDWVENCTALVEDLSGDMQLIDWYEMETKKMAEKEAGQSVVKAA